MLDKSMLDAFNEQINKELYSSYLYLSMSAYFEDKSLEGFAHWMRLQATEEYEHAMKIFDHVISRGEKPKLKTIEKPKEDWDSILEVVEEVYSHERFITKSINELVSISEGLKDYASRNFLEWFIQEQVEEEDSALELVDKVKLADSNSQAILYLNDNLLKRDDSE